MKLFSLLAVLFLFTTTQAQTNVVLTMTGSGDTITNAGSDYVYSQVQQWYQSISIQAKVTKLSGTVAGTGLLQGSIDGTNYQNIGTDTLTLANVTTNTKIWTITGSPYEFYRVYFTGSGTMTAKIYGYILKNK